MTQSGRIFAVLGLLWLASLLPAQRTATTTLVVRVDPEAHVIPGNVSLNFRVSANGAGDVTSQTETVTAWVRASNQNIHLTASAAGTLPLAALRWSGAGSQATAGGRAASCTSGSFEGGASQDLAASWTRSGTLTCAVTFSLDSRGLAPGVYTGIVNLSIR